MDAPSEQPLLSKTQSTITKSGELTYTTKWCGIEIWSDCQKMASDFITELNKSPDIKSRLFAKGLKAPEIETIILGENVKIAGEVNIVQEETGIKIRLEKKRNQKSYIEYLDTTPADHSEILSNLLEKVNYWVNRDDVIEQIINRRKNSRYLAITGLPGSGKTQLARYYLENQKKQHKKCIIREFILEESDGLKNGYLKFIDDIQVSNPTLKLHATDSLETLSEKELLGIIIEILRKKYSDHEIIFFYDNVDSKAAITTIQETVLQSPFFLNQASTVITSQQENFFSKTKEHEVGINQGFTIYQALTALGRKDLAEELLACGIQKETDRSKHEDVISTLHSISSDRTKKPENIHALILAIELINMFDCLPLAIVAAKMYMQSGYSIEGYTALIKKQNAHTLKFFEKINHANMKGDYGKKISICSQISAISLAIMNMDARSEKEGISEMFHGILPSRIMKIIAHFSNNSIPHFFIRNILKNHKKTEGLEETWFLDGFVTVLNMFSLLPSIKTTPNSREDSRIFAFHSQTFLAAQSLISAEEEQEVFSCVLDIIKLAQTEELNHNNKNIELSSIIGENFITLFTNPKVPLSKSESLILNHLNTIYNPALLLKLLEKIKAIDSESENNGLFLKLRIHIYENIINSYAEMQNEKDKLLYIREFQAWILDKKIEEPEISIAKIALHAVDKNLFARNIPITHRDKLSNTDKLKVIATLEDRFVTDGKCERAITEKTEPQLMPTIDSFEYLIYLFRRACLYLHQNHLTDALQIFDELTSLQKTTGSCPANFFHDILAAKAIVFVRLNQLENALKVLNEINTNHKEKLYLEILIKAKYCSLYLQNFEAHLKEAQAKLSLLKSALVFIPEEVLLIELFFAKKQNQHEQALSIITKLNCAEHLSLHKIPSFSSDISKRWLHFLPRNTSLVSSSYVKSILEIDILEIQLSCLQESGRYLELSKCYLDSARNSEKNHRNGELFAKAFQAYKASTDKLSCSQINSLFEPLLLNIQIKEETLIAKLWMHFYSHDAVQNYDAIIKELDVVEKSRKYNGAASLRILIARKQKNYQQTYRLVIELQTNNPTRKASPFILSDHACATILSECFSYFDQKNPDMAIECYQALHKEKSPEQFIKLGQLYLRKKDYLFALENFYQVLTAIHSLPEKKPLFSEVKKILAGVFCDLEGFYSDQKINIAEKISIYRKYSQLTLDIFEIQSGLMSLLLNNKQTSTPQAHEIKDLRLCLIAHELYGNPDLILDVAHFFYQQKEYVLAREDYESYIISGTFLYAVQGDVPTQSLRSNEGCFCKQGDAYIFSYPYQGMVSRLLTQVPEATKILQEIDRSNYFSEKMSPICEFEVINQVCRLPIFPKDFFNKRYSSQALLNLSDTLLHLQDLEHVNSMLVYVENHDKSFFASNKIFISRAYQRMAKQKEADKKNVEFVKACYRKSIAIDSNNLSAIEDEKAFLRSIGDFLKLIDDARKKYNGYWTRCSPECDLAKRELFDNYLKYVNVLVSPSEQQKNLEEAIKLYPLELRALFLLIKVLIKNNQLTDAFNKFSNIIIASVTSEYLYDYNILSIVLYTKKKEYDKATLLCSKAIKLHDDKTRFIRYLFAMMEISQSKDRNTIKDTALQNLALSSAVNHLDFMSTEEKQNLDSVFSSIICYFKEIETFDFFDGLPYFYYWYALYLKNASESTERIVNLYNSEDVSRKDDLSTIIGNIRKSITEIRTSTYLCSANQPPNTLTHYSPPKTRFEKLKADLLDRLNGMLLALESKHYDRLPAIIFVNHFVKIIEDLKPQYHSKNQNPITTIFFTSYEKIIDCSYSSDLFDDERCIKLSLLLNWYCRKTIGGNWDIALRPAVEKSQFLCALRDLRLCKKNPVEEAIERAIKLYEDGLSLAKIAIKMANFYDKSYVFINKFYSDMFSVLEIDKTDHYRKSVEEFSLSIAKSGYPSKLNNFLKNELKPLEEAPEAEIKNDNFYESFFILN